MTLRFPFFPTTDVPTLVEALAVRDARIQELEDTVARQAALIAELERRLGLNSTTSSKPPSRDGLRKPRAPKRPPVKGRKPGGPKGHHIIPCIERRGVHALMTQDLTAIRKGVALLQQVHRQAMT